jgi:hypothetical protein
MPSSRARRSPTVRLVSDNKAVTARMELAAAPRAELMVVTVQAAELQVGGDVHFQIADGLGAGRAASCMLEPRAGDLVLIAVSAGADPIIVAVLNRDSNAAATLSVPGTVGLRLAAPEIALSASGALTADVHSIAVNAEVGRFAIRTSRVFGDMAFVALNTLEAIYTKLQIYADKLITKAGSSLRIVDDTDSSIASTMLVQAKQTYSLQSTQTILTSTHDTRIDGERISMG